MTNSDTEISSTPNSQSAESVDEILSSTFDELIQEISSKPNLHKSEEHNRDVRLSQNGNSVIYDDINSYHSFCKLCDQHFYSQSVAGDINSFFQKHLNTSYHRQLRTVSLPPDDVPIFTWEEKFRSGYCNICQLSGLNAFVLSSKFEAATLVSLHDCVWDKESRETNVKILKKLNLLKIYCGLKIFQEKLLKKVNGGEVCLLCKLKLPWEGTKAKCHLFSNDHYQNFCVFLQKFFNFEPKDLLNGFNLELVTRWVISCNPPQTNEFSKFRELKMCLKYSNSNKSPYTKEEDNMSFSPKHVCDLQSDETDFIHNNMCLLCDVTIQPGHMSSELHRKKAGNLSPASFDSEEKYLIYSNKMTERLLIMKKMKELELWEETPVQKSPPKSRKSGTTEIQGNYFKTLLKEKLNLVSYIFTVTGNKEVFCHLCDEHVPFSQEGTHLNTNRHKRCEVRWNELRKESENKQFMEPFLKMKNLILCLVCGVVVNSNNFFFHLKGEMHRRKFQSYIDLNVGVPISSAFVFQKDFSCTCTVCDSLICKKVSIASLKTTLKNIQKHWPCWKLKEEKMVLRDKLELIFEANKTLVETNQNLAKEVTSVCRTCGGTYKVNESKSHAEICGMDLQKVEHVVKSIVNVFEKKIIKSALDKSADLFGQLENSDKKESRNSESDENVPVATCGCDHSEISSHAVNGDTKKSLEISKEKKTENQIGDPEGESKSEDEEEHEVLIIAGLPRSKRSFEAIYSKCSPFGKIRYVFIEGKRQVIVAFTEPGVAEKVAKEVSFSVPQHQPTLTVTKRKAHSNTAEQLPSLKKDVVLLLQYPPKLVDFMLNLIMQATAMSESPQEKTREMLVCRSIMTAMFERFPQARCYPFGSRLSGLTLNNSDLDVFLDCGGMYDGFKNTTPEAERMMVNKAGQLLRKKQEFTNIVVVRRARVPIISFLHTPTLIQCDLSFKNGLSVQNTLLIKFMMSLDWRVRPLILFLKHWAKLHGLHGRPNFSSYAISMMVIYFLQQLESPVLPTVETLQKNFTGRRSTIGGWDCSINWDLSLLKKSENKASLSDLLIEFFELYGNFDYDANVISPLMCTPLSRNAFSDSDIKKLPMCYKRHIFNLPIPIENLVKRIPICVIDPFDLSHVLTKNLSRRSLKIFIHLCKSSAECLKKGLLDLNS